MTITKIKSIPAIEGALRATEITGGALRKAATHQSEPTMVTPDPEVAEKPSRRRFRAEYKLSILRQADSCAESGDMGALLRREGLYSSNITTWRRQREEGSLSALAPKQRGRKALKSDPMVLENERLIKENTRLVKRLKQAELIIDVQKKVSQILGITLETPPQIEND